MWPNRLKHILPSIFFIILVINFIYYIILYIFKLSLAGPIIKIDQFKYASGSCQSACTPSNTNDVAITVCCFAQNNCNNVFGLGPHHNGGHSTERGVNGTRKFGGRPESTGKPRSTIKPSTIRG